MNPEGVAGQDGGGAQGPQAQAQAQAPGLVHASENAPAATAAAAPDPAGVAPSAIMHQQPTPPSTLWPLTPFRPATPHAQGVAGPSSAVGPPAPMWPYYYQAPAPAHAPVGMQGYWTSSPHGPMQFQAAAHHSPMPVATPAKRGRGTGPGRPKGSVNKKKKVDDEDQEYTPPATRQSTTAQQQGVAGSSGQQRSPAIPARSALDVNVASHSRSKCSRCQFWHGRYMLIPCYHYSFCIECIENLHLNVESPRCVACGTLIAEYREVFRSSIGDTLHSDEE